MTVLSALFISLGEMTKTGLVLRISLPLVGLRFTIYISNLFTIPILHYPTHFESGPPHLAYWFLPPMLLQTLLPKCFSR